MSSSVKTKLKKSEEPKKYSSIESIDETILNVISDSRNVQPKCGMCNVQGDNSVSGDLITCCDCGVSGHAQCLGCPQDVLERIRQKPKWQCPNCKTCQLCLERKSDEIDELIICSNCDEAYHQSCLNSKFGNTVPVHLINKWMCIKCKPVDGVKNKSKSKQKIKTKSKNISSQKSRPKTVVTTSTTKKAKEIIKKCKAKANIQTNIIKRSKKYFIFSLKIF